jgi:hypothetical protein
MVEAGAGKVDAGPEGCAIEPGKTAENGAAKIDEGGEGHAAKVNVPEIDCAQVKPFVDNRNCGSEGSVVGCPGNNGGTYIAHFTSPLASCSTFHSSARIV